MCLVIITMSVLLIMFLNSETAFTSCLGFYYAIKKQAKLACVINNQLTPYCVVTHSTLCIVCVYS